METLRAAAVMEMVEACGSHRAIAQRAELF